MLALVAGLLAALATSPASADQAGSEQRRVPAASLASGSSHTCALQSSGAVRCWGQNRYGQLGSATNNGNNDANPSPQPAVSLGEPAVAITAGSSHTCALLASGTVRCWGYNYYGQLGSATNNDNDNATPSPQPAVLLGDAAVAITAGSSHTCALLASGAVHCWGLNYDGQLGAIVNNGTYRATPGPQSVVPLGGAAVAITSRRSHTCALLASGAVRCWGDNGDGQLGSTTNTAIPAPQPAVPLGGAAVAITAGGLYTCALLASGAVRCWGNNHYGQLGSATNNGNNDANPSPQPAVPLGDAVVMATAGGGHACALLASGAVRCWGYNFYGQLGSATNNDNASPAPLGTALRGVRVRATPTLTAKVKPKKDKRAPYKFKVKGNLDGLFVKDAATCGGTVAIKVKAKGRLENGKKKTKKVLKKKTRILDTCKIKKKLKIKPKKLRKKGFDLDRKKIKLKVVMKYKGTDNLEKAKKKRKAKIKLN